MGKKAKDRTVYYEDPLNDDFSRAQLKNVSLKKGFKYVHRNPIYVFFQTFVYYVIAIPLFYLIGKCWHGVKVVGRRKLKALRHTGAFFYGNHTQEADAFMVQAFLDRRKKGYIVCGREAYALKGLGGLLTFVGALPLPETAEQRHGFIDAIEYRSSHKGNIIIYPEAHIWPYYTGIRPFREGSFVYPAKALLPVVPFCVTYRERKLFKNRKPKITIKVGNPIYPDRDMPLPDRIKHLHQETYLSLVEASSSLDNFEYIRYVKKEVDEAN